MVNFRKFYKNKANIAYIVMGYPNLDMSVKFIKRLDECNIDILEVGVPYSDPIADGEIIANAASKALENGTTIHKILEKLEKIETNKALVFMAYYNLIFAYGLKAFVKAAKKAGICGLIVPELSYEESSDLKKECDKEGLALITFISLTTPKERIAKLCKNANGFIYLLASIGLTGGKSSRNELLVNKIEEIRAYTKLPIFVGFGIKNYEDVEKIHKISDGAIVGTSIVNEFQNENIDEVIKNVKEIFKK
ncbi:tryptophan synthase subunit alpha [Campylobacter upsaliensis]|nr:tryptophan synthase subunit alpha [Campylobacter upsaliensis]EAJ0668204.1 tryptophan synthase subunit alpha [Campylobacter upsaliensis]EAJ0669799.1 tryptophan synthase subunit alpha [Campylobacter upsaliensis]EAJ1699220.1 tryptophan synthase subunit alpha [Campylobacter upsaliensis]EAJ4317105.1 tryptophan synthase subunit alpha [Campylobacter upsaliensis]